MVSGKFEPDARFEIRRAEVPESRVIESQHARLRRE
jgi:hypothetical protein